MNDSDRAELQQVKQRIETLRRDLDVLQAQTQQLELRTRIQAGVASPASPVLDDARLGAAERPVTAPAFRPEVTLRVPPPLPRVAEPVSAAGVGLARPQPSGGEEAGAIPASIQLAATAEDASPQAQGSLEMRVGTYWLVRVGVVMLLTALVFFARYAYQNFVVQLGPVGKVMLMYGVSGLLAGLGVWLERRQAVLKNYARVLFAGGLASVYFTTYAAHHIPQLRVIASPLVDGVALLVWAGVVVGIAERRKSELLCVFAVGLAYYTSVVTRVGTFTLYSNLVLAAASVVFLVRNRWAAVSVLSLTASYGAYGFWRFFHGAEWRWATPEEGLWIGVWFLGCYWVAFTVAVFLARHERLSGPGRVGFLTFNNLGFYGMFLLTMAQVHQGGFWRFSLVCGGVLLVCAALASKFLKDDESAWQAYAAQGLLLVTVGLIARVAGPELALVLSVESVGLLMVARWRGRELFAVASYIAGVLAVFYAVERLGSDTAHVLGLGGGTGLILLTAAVWSSRYGKADDRVLRPEPAFFVVLALTSSFASLYHVLSGPSLFLALAAVGLGLTLCGHSLRVREVSLLAQVYVLIGLFGWYGEAHLRIPPRPSCGGWYSAAMSLVMLLSAHWWQVQRLVPAGVRAVAVSTGLFSTGLVVVLSLWLESSVSPEMWMVLSAGLAVGVAGYALATRLWMLAAAAQLLGGESVWAFIRLHAQDWLGWGPALAPIVALALFSWGTVVWFRRRSEGGERLRQGLLKLAQAYRWLALMLALAWMGLYIPAPSRTWVQLTLAAAVLVGAVRYSNLEGVFFSAVVGVVGLACWWVAGAEAEPTRWANAGALLLIPVLQRWARRGTDRCRLEPRWLDAMLVVGGASLWWWVTRWVDAAAGGFYLTAAWAGLAFVFFLAGLTLRERLYRWMGLAVLALALGRVVVFDVWKLETLYRILSFVALGVVLLLLGYFYNRYQEKIREWL